MQQPEEPNMSGNNEPTPNQTLDASEELRLTTAEGELITRSDIKSVSTSRGKIVSQSDEMSVSNSAGQIKRESITTSVPTSSGKQVCRSTTTSVISSAGNLVHRSTATKLATFAGPQMCSSTTISVSDSVSSQISRSSANTNVSTSAISTTNPINSQRSRSNATASESSAASAAQQTLQEAEGANTSKVLPSSPATSPIIGRHRMPQQVLREPYSVFIARKMHKKVCSTTVTSIPITTNEQMVSSSTAGELTSGVHQMPQQESSTHATHISNTVENLQPQQDCSSAEIVVATNHPEATSAAQISESSASESTASATQQMHQEEEGANTSKELHSSPATLPIIGKNRMTQQVLGKPSVLIASKIHKQVCSTTVRSIPMTTNKQMVSSTTAGELTSGVHQMPQQESSTYATDISNTDENQQPQKNCSSAAKVVATNHPEATSAAQISESSASESTASAAQQIHQETEGANKSKVLPSSPATSPIIGRHRMPQQVLREPYSVFIARKMHKKVCSTTVTSIPITTNEQMVSSSTAGELTSGVHQMPQQESSTHATHISNTVENLQPQQDCSSAEIVVATNHPEATSAAQMSESSASKSTASATQQMHQEEEGANTSKELHSSPATLPIIGKNRMTQQVLGKPSISFIAKKIDPAAIGAANQLEAAHAAAPPPPPQRAIPAKTGLLARFPNAPPVVHPSAQMHANQHQQQRDINTSRRHGFNCGMCGQHFLLTNELYEHIRRCTGEERFNCEKCDSGVALSKRELEEHMEVMHNENEPGPGSMMSIPVVDASQPRVVERIRHLGVTHVVPLSTTSQGQPQSAIPIISLDQAQSAEQVNLENLGAGEALALGSLKTLEDQ